MDPYMAVCVYNLPLLFITILKNYFYSLKKIKQTFLTDTSSLDTVASSIRRSPKVPQTSKVKK